MPSFGGTKTKAHGQDGLEDFVPIDFAELQVLAQLPKSTKLQNALNLFRGGQTSAHILSEITDFIKEETQADDVAVLRMHGEDFEVIAPHSLQRPLYNSKKMTGMNEAIYKHLPVLIDRSYTHPWTGIFKTQPEFLFLIPVTVTGPKAIFLTGVAVMVYNNHLSTSLDSEDTWHTILDYLDLTLPLLVNVHKYEESNSRAQRFVQSLEAVSAAEKDIHEIRTCVKTLASELVKIFKVEFVQVLLVQQEIIEDRKLIKYCNIGGSILEKEKCPAPHVHQAEELKIAGDTIVGYVAITGHCVRVNNVKDLQTYGIPTNNGIHSIGGCLVNNILCISITELAGEAPMIIELSNKQGGFTYQDEEEALFLAKRASGVYSASLLLDYKKKSIRRHGIRNEVLANIGEVSYFKVKQLLDLKFDYSSSFRKKLLSFTFTMRIFPDHQSPGVILYMFIDLGFTAKWKIRKSTLIRFILSIQQGYRDIPYHNWKHACCVTHFAYVLLKKLDLVHLGYLTDLEALTLIISCMAHDVDHRGRNNHFNLCTKSELYHLYKQEDSIMERHHIAVTLSVINSEDCNILQNLTDEEYRTFLDLVQWNILATDLAKYMQNRYDYFYTLTHFEKSEKTHRKHLSAVIMTCSDLCDNVKTWDQNLPCVKSVFHEFFAQGDDEINLGLKPMPMMDKRVAYIPQIEIQFLNGVVRPAYQSLADLLPHTRVCLHTLDYFEDLWLVATSVFDENVNSEDPLLILDLKEMKEENLKRRAAPQLQTILMEHGVPAISIAQMATINTGSIGSLQQVTASNEKVFGEHEDTVQKSSLLIPATITAKDETSERKLNYCELLKSYICCYTCRNRGLVAARAVRKLKLETEYLAKRVNHYERRRSHDDSNSSSGGGPPTGGSTSSLY